MTERVSDFRINRRLSGSTNAVLLWRDCISVQEAVFTDRVDSFVDILSGATEYRMHDSDEDHIHELSAEERDELAEFIRKVQDEDGRLIRIDDSAHAMAKTLGIELRLGERSDTAEIGHVIDALSDAPSSPPGPTRKRIATAPAPISSSSAVKAIR